MINKKHWLIRLFIIFFSISVSVAIVPCGIVNVYGSLGEIYSTTIEVENEVEQIKAKSFKIQKEKGINIFNVWFILYVFVLYISFIEYMIQLPRGDTIITLKVRMDH